MQVLSNEDMHSPARFWGDPASAHPAAVALFFARLPGTRTAYVDSPHTFVQQERHAGRLLAIHRKGAVRAERESLACVAGTARSGNWIVEGLGNAEALESFPHGAGRRRVASAVEAPLGRARVRGVLAAARERTLTTLQEAGIELAVPADAFLLSDDHPHPSADPTACSDLARPIHHLRPLGLYRS